MITIQFSNKEFWAKKFTPIPSFLAQNKKTMPHFIRIEKGMPISTLVGVSPNIEKNFNRSIICIKEKDKVYKIISVNANKADGSLNIFFPYCKEKKAYIYRHIHKYKAGIQKIKKTQITKEYTVDIFSKLSIHRSGFVQLSGNGIKSGIDKSTGLPKGIGLFSSPLNTPVNSGPTFSFQCWGVENNFEILQKKNKEDQYIVLEIKNSDFTERIMTKNKIPNSYVLEFFIFPKEANNFIYEFKNEPYIDHIISNYIHNPGGLFAHHVLDIKNFKEVLCVFPATIYIEFDKLSPFGYMLNSPGGSNHINDKSKTGNNFHLVCPRSLDIFKNANIDNLEFNK